MRETQYSESTQSYTVVTTVQTIADVPLRATVKRDSYAHQSFAILEAWDATRLQWNRIHDLPYSIWTHSMPSTAGVSDAKVIKARERAAANVTADLLGYAERFLGLAA